MVYQRKTRDEYQLHVDYGQGWEHEISGGVWYGSGVSTAYQTKVVCKRVPIKTEG